MRIIKKFTRKKEIKIKIDIYSIKAKYTTALISIVISFVTFNYFEYEALKNCSRLSPYHEKRGGVCSDNDEGRHALTTRGYCLIRFTVDNNTYTIDMEYAG